MRRVGHHQVVGAGHHQAADAAGGLRVAERGFTSRRLVEQFRHPGERGYVFHGHTDERQA